MKQKLYELSQPFWAQMPTTKALGPFVNTVKLSLDTNLFQLSEISFASHIGCHMDAPRHYFKDGASIDQIPPKRLIARCVVVEALKGRNGLITVEDVIQTGLLVGEGDFVFFHTGWGEKFGAEDFYEGASLSEELAQWLVDQKVGAVGIDTCTVDLAHNVRPEGFDAPVHRKLLSHNILILECLTLAEVSGMELRVYALPMFIKDCDGAPVRVIAEAWQPVFG